MNKSRLYGGKKKKAWQGLGQGRPPLRWLSWRFLEGVSAASSLFLLSPSEPTAALVVAEDPVDKGQMEGWSGMGIYYLLRCWSPPSRSPVHVLGGSPAYLIQLDRGEHEA